VLTGEFAQAGVVAIALVEYDEGVIGGRGLVEGASACAAARMDGAEAVVTGVQAKSHQVALAGACSARRQ
jgi:hypothetical protein